MRITLSLDDDVAASIVRIIRETKVSLKEIVNDALRRGLADIHRPRERVPLIETEPRDLGRCLLGNVDDISASLTASEGKSFR